MLIDTEKLLTLTQAAQRTGLSEQILRGRYRRGEIALVKLGSNLYVTIDEVERFRAVYLLTGGS